MNADGTTDSPLLLDRYRVEGLLGTGGLGSVVSAFDVRLQRKVAIKTLKRSVAPVDPVQLRAIEDRFSREAIAGARMGIHPNLVAVYDTVAGPDETLYLILEYVHGGTLDQRLRAAGTLPLGAALRLTTDIARGLLAAHDAGLVHRDIKPANIFLGADGRAQVGDFGIAQIDDVSGRTQATASHPGTPLYMSPEQESMTGYLRPNTDQFALGLVLFEMLTGKMYKRLSKREAAALLATQPPPVVALIERLIAVDPDDRYPDMARVMSAVQAITTAIDTGADFRASSHPSVPDSGPATVLDTPPPGVSSVQSWQPTPSHSFGPPPSFGSPPSSPSLASQPPYPVAPAQPARMGRRRALFAIGGIVVAGAAGGGYLLLGRGATATATATPESPTAAASPTGVSTAAGTPVTSNVAAIATVAISTPTATPRPTVTPGPTTTPVVAKFSTRVIADALSHPEQWQMDKIPNQSTRTLDNNTYAVRVFKKPDGSGLFSWGNWVPPEGVRGTDFIAEVEMRLQGDAAGAAGGFVFLYNYASNVNEYQYMTYMIRGDRKFSVAQQLPGGEGHDHRLIDLAQQAAIKPGTDVINLLRIEVRQGKFSCYANNQPIYLDQVVPNEVVGFNALAFAANVTKESVESSATAIFSNLRYEKL